MREILSDGILSHSPLFNLQPVIDFGINDNLDISKEALQRIEQFCTNLFEKNKVCNLTRVPVEEFINRHIVDSLLIHSLIPPKSKVLDIGTGPGLPSWPLALVRPDLQVTAIDSSGKMIEFLSSNLLPNLTAMLSRAEETANLRIFDVVTGRAVAPLAIQLEVSTRMAKIGGLVIPFRTESEDFELSESAASKLGLELASVTYKEWPGLMQRRAFPLYRKRRHIAKNSWRTWAQMKAKPLLLQ